MSSAGIQLSAYTSAHTLALNQLAAPGGSVSPWARGFKSVTNFALHKDRVVARSSASTGEFVFDLDSKVIGDIATGAYLQIRLPKLEGKSGYHSYWVWGLGYAMIESVRFEINGSQAGNEVIRGEYLEILSELHSNPGQTFNNVWKYDDITVPELVKLSGGEDNVLYIPLNFYWTRSNACVLPIQLLKSRGTECSITVNFRNFQDIVVSVPMSTSAGAEVDTRSTNYSVTKKGDQNESSNDYNSMDISLFLDTVILENGTPEYSLLTSQTYKALAPTQKSLYGPNGNGSAFKKFTDGVIDETSLTINHPVKSIIWAIKDEDKNLINAGTADPFGADSAGVRKLFGAKAGHATNQSGVNVTTATITSGQVTAALDVDVTLSTAIATAANVTVYRNGSAAPSSQFTALSDDDDTLTILAASLTAGDIWQVVEDGFSTGGDVIDYNVVRSGSHDLNTDARIRSSNDVLRHRNDGLNSCLHIPRNRFDYRTADASGNEVEPLKSVVLKLANQTRWSSQLETNAVYFRTVQPLSYCNRVPRKGIYMYSFAVNASSPLPSGSANLSRIYNKQLTIRANSTSDPELCFFSEYHNILEILPAGGQPGLKYV